MQKTNKKGFTLIELLVVISIIGLLSTLAVVSLGNARQKARDAKVKSDIKNISTAMELYAANDSSGEYYSTVGACGADILATAATNGDVCVGESIEDSSNSVLLNQIPDSPTANDYTYTGTVSGYCFRGELEVNDGTNIYFTCTTGGVCQETATDC